MIISKFVLNKVNRNGRFYSQEVFDKAINAEFIQEALKSHSLFVYDSPRECETGCISDIVGAINSIETNDEFAEINWELLDTPAGRRFLDIADDCIVLPRLVGDVHTDFGIEVVDNITIMSFNICANKQ